MITESSGMLVILKTKINVILTFWFPSASKGDENCKVKEGDFGGQADCSAAKSQLHLRSVTTLAKDPPSAR